MTYNSNLNFGSRYIPHRSWVKIHLQVGTGSPLYPVGAKKKKFTLLKHVTNVKGGCKI
jgi:hypothetical protein